MHPLSQASDRLTAATLGLVTGVYLWLAFGVLPAGGYWSIDNGYKRIQADNIRFTPWLDLAIRYPGQALDPTFQYLPFGPSFHYKWRGQIHLSQPAAIAILGKPFIMMLGDRGELVVPVFAGLTSLWLLAGLMQALELGPPWGGILLAGLATPMIFYSLNFWEHTLAVALGLAALLLIVTGMKVETSPGWRYLLAGVLAASAAGVRKEMLIFVMLCGGWVALAAFRRRSWRGFALWLSGVTVVLGGLWFFSYASSSYLVPPELRLSVTPRYTPQAYILAHGLNSLPDFILGPNSGPIGGWLLVALGLYGLLPWLPQARLREALRLMLLLAFMAGVGVLAQHYPQAGNVYGILSVAPFLVLGLTPERAPSPDRRWVLMLTWGYWGLAVIGIGLFTTAGPWHSAQEWGARFMLVVFPLGAMWAASGLRHLWEGVSQSWLARLNFLAALTLVGLSVYIQALGIQAIRSGVSAQGQVQAIVLEWPETQVFTNLDRLAPLMPRVYATKRIWLVPSFQDLSAGLRQLYAHGERSFVFVSTGMLSEGSLPEIAPAGLRLTIVETRALGRQLYGTRVTMTVAP